MPAATARVARVRPAAPEPAGVNWERLGVLAALGANLVAGAIAFATVRADVSNLRAEIPPGSVQVLLDRTEKLQAAIDKLEPPK